MFVCVFCVSQGVAAGVLRGSGRQHLGVAVVFMGYCLLGLPIGIPVMFTTSAGLSGLSYVLLVLLHGERLTITENAQAVICHWKNFLLFSHMSPKTLAGLWVALAGALFLDAIVYSMVLYRTDWEKQAKLAMTRVTKATTSSRSTDETTGKNHKINICNSMNPVIS